ncbi:hypothetical protein B9Z19DRAFT_989308 [Tuber borchii]|uniref:Rhodopsin domain-containing protein n=1 Tax=Tuber borchii TaxID=42251 RepID=A0A2T6ZMW6_TUBBO|nr:hypothetical protein B9Z19DRAFT_989308 [Tuber borchii]
MVGALAALVVRVVLIHLVLMNGTNNLSDPRNLSDGERRRREFGSKMVLITRTCYVLFIWFMKFGIVSFYERIVVKLESRRVWLKYLIFGRQVYPDPGEACSSSQAQLYTTGVCNIFTDLILIIYPLPIIFNTGLRLRRKLQIGGLFSLGFFVIIVTIFRLTFVVRNNVLLKWRALFGHIEMLVACFVANAPALYRTIGVRVHITPGTRYSGEVPLGRYCFAANRRGRAGGRGLSATSTEEPEEGEGPVGGGLVCMLAHDRCDA